MVLKPCNSSRFQLPTSTGAFPPDFERTINNTSWMNQARPWQADLHEASTVDWWFFFNVPPENTFFFSVVSFVLAKGFRVQKMMWVCKVQKRSRRKKKRTWKQPQFSVKQAPQMGNLPMILVQFYSHQNNITPTPG